ncbi:BGN_3a_G0051290.mRNA.1.CDS.1 [Saccharomyces cerevisiae]|nr:BGN_3a_G0051290.mRNA.1.CDS.1 [Saccharomyces cerevisiae]CAI7351554.1 BGN_3a_G0051290.mRNA.1.CDS.1 [Saccharomyces cerevisiae]CAI7356604.1 ASN_collapsed_G0052130.mRNA.1.CDS.1 [Saccharomyces cerevisiae]
MPVTKSLSKLQKNLSKKGKNITVHPKGRKYEKLVRATMREDKIAAKKKLHQDKRVHELARVKFMQDVVNSDTFKGQPIFDHAHTREFIQSFIERDDTELDELKKKRRSNRPPSNRQVLLQQRRDKELKEFKAGFLCPDLSDAKNMEFLRNWNGTFGLLNTLRLIRINDKGEQVVGGNE